MMKKLLKSGVAAALAAVCGLFVVASSAVSGQNTNSSSTQNTNSSSMKNTNTGSAQDMNGNRSMNSNSGGMMVSSTDRKFMEMAAMGGMAEVEMGRVALERASSASVKEYAQKMIDDHTKANDELKQLAEMKGVRLPVGVDPKHLAMMDKMKMMSGAEFDHEYVKNAGVKDHEKMLKLVQDEARKGKDADAKAFASKMIPAVQMHLQMARDMMSSMMGAKGNKTSMKM